MRRGTPRREWPRVQRPGILWSGPRSLGCHAFAALCVLAWMFAVLTPVRAAHARALVVQRYGVDPAQVQAAINAAGWPQQNRVWCGIATMTAVIDFHQQTYSQQQVADYLNSAPAASAWGTPKPDPAIAWGPGVAADISRDVSTDPRAMAAGQSALADVAFHQVIDRGSALEATRQLAADVASADEPVNVIVFHGGHAVLVSAVLASDNPVTDPASITALEVWDPGYGVPNGNIQLAQMVDVPIDEWLSNDYYWATPYEEGFQGTIAEDPDPAVGPYAYNPAQGQPLHLWVGHYVYIRPDAPTDAFHDVSADWAVNQAHVLIRGAHDEQPTGYTGPTVGIGNDTVRPGVPATAPPTAPAVPTIGSAPSFGSSGNDPLAGLCGPGLCQMLLDIPLWLCAVIPIILFALIAVVTLRAERKSRARRRRRPSEEWWRTRDPGEVPWR